MDKANPECIVRNSAMADDNYEISKGKKSHYIIKNILFYHTLYFR